MSNVYATQAIAEAHIAELHRVAAQRRTLAGYRRARATGRHSPIGTLALRKPWGNARLAVAAWVSPRTAKATSDPVCCPA